MADRLKDPKTYDQQLQKLIARGCVVQDEEFCKQKLAEINYYRFTAYFLPFKLPDNTYLEGTTFQMVYRIYEFDRKLRAVLFSAVEEIEIYLRSQLAYFHGHKYGSEGYMNADTFSPHHDHVKFIETIEREIKNNEKTPCVKHHQIKYGGHFPIWAICELFTFGTLSYFYADMKMADKKALSRELYHTVPQNIDSWLRCCTDLRNMCAHYSRLYYRNFPAIPRGLNLAEWSQRKLWGAIMAARALFPSTEKWNTEICVRISGVMTEYDQDIELAHIGFPSDWEVRLRKLPI